jgi:RNA polymerase sigma-70 factor, ECF subfamily
MRTNTPEKAGSFDAESFLNQIYAAHYQAVHAYFLGRTGDGDVALDLLQETFLRLWRNLSALQEVASERQRYWIFTVARNVLTDNYRKRAARSAAYERLERQANHPPAAADDPEKGMAEEEMMQFLNSAIRRLPEDLRTVLVMQVLGNMTSSEIGEAVGKPAGTVRYQISQARKRLAAEIKLLESSNVQEVNEA